MKSKASHNNQRHTRGLNRLAVIAVFINGFLSLSLQSQAQESEPFPELVKELFVGERVNMQGRKELQLSTTSSFRKYDGQRLLTFPFAIEYGFTERLQAAVALPYHKLRTTTGETASGIGNAEIGVKYKILRGTGPFALSASVSSSLPGTKNNKGLAEEEQEWEAQLIAGKKIGQGQLHVAAGTTVQGGECAFIYNVAAIYPWRNWRLVTQFSGSANEEKTMLLTPGLVWRGLDDFELGAAYQKNLSANEWGVLLRFTYEIIL